MCLLVVINFFICFLNFNTLPINGNNIIDLMKNITYLAGNKGSEFLENYKSRHLNYTNYTNYIIKI